MRCFYTHTSNFLVRLNRGTRVELTRRRIWSTNESVIELSYSIKQSLPAR